MQTLKDHIRRGILETARRRFLADGFLGATMRDIASESGCSLGNLYTYFANKDELLAELVRPTIASIRSLIETASLLPRGDGLAPVDFVASHPQEAFRFLEEHREPLVLLLLHSEGSRLSGFRETLAQELTDLLARHIENGPGSSRQPSEPSPFFLHQLATFLIVCVEEVIHHELPASRLPGFLEETARFVSKGMKSS